MWLIDATYVASAALGIKLGGAHFKVIISNFAFLFATGKFVAAGKNFAINRWLEGNKDKAFRSAENTLSEGVLRKQALASRYLLTRGSGLILWSVIGLTFLHNTGISVQRLLSFAGIGGLALGYVLRMQMLISKFN